MTLKIAQPGTYAATAYGLSNGQDFLVAEGVVVNSTGGTGLATASVGAHVTVNGTLQGTDGIVFGSMLEPKTGMYLTIGASGTVGGHGDRGIGIFLGSVNIVNHGLIAGFDEGIQVSLSSGNVGPRIVNYGQIMSGGNAIDCSSPSMVLTNYGTVTSYSGHAFFSNSGTDTVNNSGTLRAHDDNAIKKTGGTLTVNNSGQIQSVNNSDAVYAGSGAAIKIVNTGTISSNGGKSFFGDSAVDSVTNKGTMNGDINLHYNNDVYEGNGGRVNGTVFGAPGNDSLRGGALLDRLDGGSNNDYLTGRGGRDDLTGGLDADQFIYTAITDSGITAVTRDIIRDFNVGNDVFNLSAIDSNTSIAGNQAFALLAKGTTASAVGPAKIGWYWVDNANDALDRTILRINNDADAAIEMTIELVGLKTLSATPGVDFIF